MEEIQKHTKHSTKELYSFNNSLVNLNNKIVKIFCNSYYGTFATTNSTGHVLFNFKQPIVVDNTYFLSIAIDNFSIPCSFYNINSNNNYLSINYREISNPSNEIDEEIYLTEGNYSAYTLRDLLNGTSLSTYGITVSYSSITNTFTFTTTTYEIIIFSDSTCLELIGISTSVDEYLTTFTSDNVIDLTYTKSIYIAVNNLVFDNIDMRIGTRSSNILCTILKNVNQGELITYQPDQKDFIIIQNKFIDHLDIQIQDDKNNTIEMNNINWGLTLIIKYNLKSNDLTS